MITPNLQQYLPLLQKLLSAIVIFLAFYVSAKLTQSIIHKMVRKTHMDQHIVINLLGTTVKISIICVGLITSFGTVGINVSALVASLGLTGFGLSFALKDTLSSAISGIMILLYRPFSVGDQIHIASHSGTVLKIDLRYVTLKTDDAQQVLVPNALVFKQSIVLLDQSKQSAL